LAGAAWSPDFQYEYLPEYFAAADLHSRRKVNAQLARHAAQVVLSSEQAAEDFRRLYPDVAGKAVVMHFQTALNPDWLRGSSREVARRYHLPDRYLIVCNQFWAHKNHLQILQAMHLLRQEHGLIVPVVFTGHPYDHRKPAYIDQVFATLHQHGLHEQVKILGMISRADQMQLIRGAAAIIQPSRFEGWSTVVEDGRAQGKMVVLSDIPVHREQNPPQSRFFPLDDTRLLAQQMQAVWVEDRTERSLEELLAANAKDLERFGATFLQIAGMKVGGK
jgi:glycosyltransferase involved in cell wall biosynthesis